jgi:hypothetical protein
VKQLERLVVHVEEAIRLATASDEAHLRLGLILLDSAAELLMHRHCDGFLNQSSLYDRLLERMEEVPDEDRDEKYRATVKEIRSHAISKTRRKKIEKEFDAKCDFLREKDLLAQPQVRVLKKLHDYRNETYHRDEVRSGTLASAAKIYMYLVCTMMRDIPERAGQIIWPLHTTRDVTPILRKYIDTSEPGPLDRDLRAAIATQLMEASGIGEAQKVGLALAQHVQQRLDEIEQSAAWTVDWFKSTAGDDTWDLEASLRMAQASWGQMEAVDSAEDARTLEVLVGLKQIEEWRRTAERLKSETSDLHAFAAFADLEDAFEPFEKLVDHQMKVVDKIIQDEIDFIRGK